MYEVIVLFNGYSFPTETGTTKANCTCTLLKGPSNIIVDTMTPWDGPKLTEALKVHNLTPAAIDYVICTHGHSDHTGCNYLFRNARRLIVGHDVSSGDEYYDFDFDKNDYVIDDCVKLVSTPGHTKQHVSVVVTAKDGSVVVVAGDLFEREEDLTNDKLWRGTCAFDESVQAESRAKVLKYADYIVPGHGAMFKNVYNK